MEKDHLVLLGQAVYDKQIIISYSLKHNARTVIICSDLTPFRSS
jgi:hypothetical protein